MMDDDSEFEDYSDWTDCWQCGGLGVTAGCFEDCCSGADCDPEDAEYCCNPRRCDVCKGKGGWTPDEKEKPAAQEAEIGVRFKTFGGGALMPAANSIR